MHLYRLLCFSLILICPASSYGAPASGEAPAVEVEAGEGLEPGQEQDPKWFSCTVDDECMLVQAGCNREAAVNKEFGDDYREWQEKSSGQVECPPITGKAAEAVRRSPVARCRDGACVIQLPNENAESNTAPAAPTE